MIIPNAVFGDKMKYLREEDYEDSPEHMELQERLCKTLYYGRMPTLDRPSLSVTELAVEVLQDVAPKELGKVDMDWAAAVSREVLMSPCSLMVGMMYSKRLKKKGSSYRRQISSSDLFLVSVMVASKFLYDEGEEDGVVNEEWAASSNMDVEELNRLERNFLDALEWELFVNADDFWATVLSIEQCIAWRRGLERGSFTYTDLALVADSTICRTINHLLLEVCKVVAVCAVAYVASVVLLAMSQPVVYVAVAVAPRLPTCCQSSAPLPSVDISGPADVEEKSFPVENSMELCSSNAWQAARDFFYFMALTETLLTTASSVLFHPNPQATTSQEPLLMECCKTCPCQNHSDSLCISDDRLGVVSSADKFLCSLHKNGQAIGRKWCSSTHQSAFPSGGGTARPRTASQHSGHGKDHGQHQLMHLLHGQASTKSDTADLEMGHPVAPSPVLNTSHFRQLLNVGTQSVVEVF